MLVYAKALFKTDCSAKDTRIEEFLTKCNSTWRPVSFLNLCINSSKEKNENVLPFCEKVSNFEHIRLVQLLVDKLES